MARTFKAMRSAWQRERIAAEKERQRRIAEIEANANLAMYSPLPLRATWTPQMRRGFVFAMRANGIRYKEIAQAVGATPAWAWQLAHSWHRRYKWIEDTTIPGDV